jgi:hypothetical protein
LSLDGATLRPDTEANRKLYGSDIVAKQILAGAAQPPESARGLLETLAKYATPKPGEEIEEAPAPAPAPKKEPEPTLLTVTSAPEYAEIELNHNFNGLTPRTKQIAPGEYQITVNKKGFEPWTKTVKVVGGEALTIHAELTKLEASADNTSASNQPASNSGIRVSGWQPKP